MKKTLLFTATGVASAAALWALWANAAVGTVIKVTTFLDEDGSNPAACSLREAIKAINTQATYGGCPAGVLVGDNVVQLEAGTYTLTLPAGALEIDRALVVAGADTWDRDNANPLTGSRPNRARPLTTIQAVAGQRLFKTKTASAGLTLRDLIIEGNGAVAGNGGLIYAASSVSMDNVQARNGHSNNHGGFLFLANDNASLTASNSTFDSNQADQEGGVIAMACQQDLSALARHEVSISQSLLKSNSSATGAAVIEACGNTTIKLENATLSANSSTASSGAIAYDQTRPGRVVGYGSISLDHVTAAEHATGAVLYVDSIQSTSINSSILAWNTTSSCVVPNTPTNRSGYYNAYGDSSCNVLTPGSTTNQDVSAVTLASQLNALGAHEGLTDIYLPIKSSSSLILDKGMAKANCTGVDQRGVARSGGTDCDIGAAERMQVAASEVTSTNTVKTDRLAIVDVMATARFGESTSGVHTLLGVQLPGPTDTTDPDFMYDANLYGGATPKCRWHDDNDPDEKLKRKLVVHNSGVLTASTPIVCQYKVEDSNNDLSEPSTVTVDIKNIPPIAAADTYIRPQGVTSITFNPLTNDSDEGDGVYGATPWWPTTVPYIYVAEAAQPKLGKIKGTPTGAYSTGDGACPDSTISAPRVCYFPPLTYEAFNPDSPFSDSFTYSVYDKDGTASSSATVTVNTDAPDYDKGAGSVDMGLGAILALLGWRQLRRRSAK